MENILKKCIMYVMRIRPFFYSLVGICAAYTVAHGATSGTKSFITAQSFPKTFDDLSFTDRLAVKTEGYEIWDSEYDASGRCVKNCAYPGITIQEEEYLSYKAGQELRELIEEEEKLKKEEAEEEIEDEEEVVVVEDEEEPITPVNPHTSSFFGAPLARSPMVVTSDFGYRDLGYGSTYHKGVDLRAGSGTPVYAAANGTIIKADDDAGGNEGKKIEIEHSFSHSNKKVYTEYLHLSLLNVRAGDTVVKGQQIGKAGKTGCSVAHLDYRIKFGGYFVDPTGSKIRPNLGDRQKETNAMATSGYNYLVGPYYFKYDAGIRVNGKSVQYLKDNFPGCEGFSN